MSDRLSGKVAIITGATSGIGESTAEVFAREGAKVIVAGRSEKKGNKIADHLGKNAIFHPNFENRYLSNSIPRHNKDKYFRKVTKI